MSKLSILRARDLIKVAKKQGFVYEVTHDSHYIFRRPTDGKNLSIPVHKGKTHGYNRRPIPQTALDCQGTFFKNVSAETYLR